MRMYIPQVGDQIKLDKDWTFQASSSWRYKLVKFTPVNGNITIPAGTVLKVSTISIKRGQQDSSGLTFTIPLGPFKGSKFFAKLKDVNDSEIDQFAIQQNETNPVYWSVSRIRTSSTASVYQEGMMLGAAYTSSRTLLANIYLSSFEEELINKCNNYKYYQYNKVRMTAKDMSGNIIAEDLPLSTLKKRVKEHFNK